VSEINPSSLLAGGGGSFQRGGRHKTHEGARDRSGADTADASRGLETTKMEPMDPPIVRNRTLQRSRQSGQKID
jgi:hypothetical protein